MSKSLLCAKMTGHIIGLHGKDSHAVVIIWTLGHHSFLSCHLGTPSITGPRHLVWRVA